LKGRIVLNWHCFLKRLRKVLFVSGVIEKVLIISKAIEDTGDGIEELEKNFKSRSNKKKDC